MTRALRVAIIGGGIGGLTTACALRLRGFEVAVYERARELREVGAGLQLGPNGVKVLDALGFGAPLAAFACEPPNMVSVAWDTAALRYRQPLGAGARAKFGAPYYMAHRADLYQLLIDALPPAALHLGETCSACENTEAGAQARFESGLQVEADVIIAADGIRSRLRQDLFGGETVRYTGHMGWRAMIPMDEVPAGIGPDRVSLREDFVGILGPRGHCIMYPIRSGEVLNFFAGYFTDQWAEESWTVPSSPQEMVGTFAGWCDDLHRLMSRVQSCFKWGIYDRDPVPHWCRGRIALLGDAAHPMMPTLAQGAAIAIEDGYVLARCLDAGRADPAAALLSYEAERRPRAARVQLQARQQYLNNKLDPSPPPLSRDWIFAHDATTGQDWPGESAA